MNNEFHFSEFDTSNAFQGLGAHLGSYVIDNRIQVPQLRGKGSIRKLDFEKGLHIRAWDLHLKNDLTLKRSQNHEQVPGGKSFTILYTLSPEAVEIDSPVLVKPVRLNGTLNILFLSNNYDISFRISREQEIKALDITVTSEWMIEQFADSAPMIRSFINKINMSFDPTLFMDKGSPQEYRTAYELHAQTLESNKSTLYLKSKTLSLLSDFFARVFENSADEILQGKALHQDKMMAIEKVLEKHVDRNLPSIAELAKIVCLSESTLKRHFKLMYGKSVYDYYLEKKMEYAKRLLMEKPITVKEVAYRLGYEKPSNFIHIFQKFYAYSPGFLKKTQKT